MNDIDSIITELCEQGAQAVERYASVGGRLATSLRLRPTVIIMSSMACSLFCYERMMADICASRTGSQRRAQRRREQRGPLRFRPSVAARPWSRPSHRRGTSNPAQLWTQGSSCPQTVEHVRERTCDGLHLETLIGRPAICRLARCSVSWLAPTLFSIVGATRHRRVRSRRGDCRFAQQVRHETRAAITGCRCDSLKTTGIAAALAGVFTPERY
jgi:hypothetical protein